MSKHLPSRTHRSVTLHKVLERLDVKTGAVARMVHHPRGQGVIPMIDGHTVWCCDPGMFTASFVDSVNCIGKGRYIFTITEQEYEA